MIYFGESRPNHPHHGWISQEEKGGRKESKASPNWLVAQTRFPVARAGDQLPLENRLYSQDLLKIKPFQKQVRFPFQLSWR